MSLKRIQSAGPNFVPAYQISSVPWVTSSVAPINTDYVQYKFPYATRFIQVTNRDPSTGLRFAFSLDGLHGQPDPSFAQYYILPALVAGSDGAAASCRLEVRTKELFLCSHSGAATADFSLLAGMSGVKADQFPHLTGSQGFEGV